MFEVNSQLVESIELVTITEIKVQYCCG